MEKTTKIWRSGLALFLALCMVIGVIPATAFAAAPNDDVLNYVSFGASNANGYGLSGYLPAGITAADKATANVYGYQRMPVGSYPYLLAEELNKVLGGTETRYNGNLKETQPFSKVNVSQLAMSSMRIEELRFLLDESYAGDSYTAWRFYGPGSQNWFGMAESDLATLRGVYNDAVKNADVITLDMGINNFGVYISHQVGNKYGETLEDIDPELAAKYAEAKEQIKQMVANYSADAVAMMEQMNGMIDALAYALAGFCTSFDVVIEKINQLNPNAKIVVVSIQNLLTGLSVEIEGFEDPLPLGDIFGAVINTANLYTASGSPYCDGYLYADVRKNGRVDFFVDELLEYDGDPTTLSQNMIDCYDVYDDDLRVSEQVQGLIDGYLAGQIKDGLGTYLGFMPTVYGTSDEGALLQAFLADGADGFPTASVFAAAYGSVGADCLATMQATYNAYTATRPQLTQLALTMAYDVITELFKAGVEDHTISFAALTDPRKGAVENALLGKILSTAQAAIEMLAVDPTYQFTLSEAYPDGFYETIAAEAGLPLTLVKSVACMGIRTGIGNSFYGHPTPAGHQEIKDIIWSSLKDEVTGKDVVENEIKVILNELKGFLEEYGPNVAEQAYDLWIENGYQEKVDQYIAELAEILEARKANYTDVVLPALNDTIAALTSQKEALNAELTVLKAQLEVKKAELEKALAENPIPGISAPDLSIDTEIGNNEQTNVPENDCPGVGNTPDELAAAVSDLEHAIAVIEALIADITADINDMVALAKDIADAIASLTKTLADVAAAAKAVKEAVDAVAEVLTDDSAKAAAETFLSAFNTAREAALTAVDALVLLADTAKADAAAIEAAAAVLEKAVTELSDKLAGDEEAFKNILISNIPDDKLIIGGLAWTILEDVLKAKEPEINAAIEAKKAALEAEYSAKIAAAAAALAEKKAEIEPQLKAAYEAKVAELTAKAEAEIAALEAAAAEKLAALEAELAAKQAELAALAEDVAEEVRAGIQAQIDRITGDIETVKADLACAAEHVNAAAKAAVEALVEELTHQYNEAIAQLQQAYDNLVAEYEAAVKELEDAVGTTLEGIAQQVQASIEALKQSLIDLGLDTIEGVVSAITALVNDILHQATHADLVLNAASTYVALGDGSAETESYVEMLAARLQAEYGIAGYTNYAAAGNTVGSVKENLGSYAELADADLITLGFSNVTILNKALAGLAAETPVEYDWAKLVGESLVPYVQEALAQAYAEVAAMGLDAELTAMLNVIIEGVAYGTLEYAIELPQLIAAIREVNADAVIVIVGQYDPMDGAALKFGDVTVDVSQYIGYFVKGVAAHGIAYCILTGEAIFVEAPEVATANTDKELTLADLLKLLVQGFAPLYPNEAGDTYITNQILGALNITVTLWGDADSNGKITLRDAILVLQAANGKDVTIDRKMSDVNGDGSITLVDAVLVLKRANGHTDRFPAEG